MKTLILTLLLTTLVTAADTPTIQFDQKSDKWYAYQNRLAQRRANALDIRRQRYLVKRASGYWKPGPMPAYVSNPLLSHPNSYQRRHSPTCVSHRRGYINNNYLVRN